MSDIRPMTSEELLKEQLRSLLNCASRENESNTPDFVLANYLLDCLRAFELATNQRAHWYGLKEGAK